MADFYRHPYFQHGLLPRHKGRPYLDIYFPYIFIQYYVDKPAKLMLSKIRSKKVGTECQIAIVTPKRFRLSPSSVAKPETFGFHNNCLTLSYLFVSSVFSPVFNASQCCELLFLVNI